MSDVVLVWPPNTHESDRPTRLLRAILTKIVNHPTERRYRSLTAKVMERLMIGQDDSLIVLVQHLGFEKTAAGTHDLPLDHDISAVQELLDSSEMIATRRRTRSKSRGRALSTRSTRTSLSTVDEAAADKARENANPHWALLDAVETWDVSLSTTIAFFAAHPSANLLKKMVDTKELQAIDATSAKIPEHVADGHLNKKLSLFSGDITNLRVDAIVNAANTLLAPGGGVSGAIHRKAGPDMLKECEAIGGCESGEVIVTKGYQLPAKYVFHTVGPHDGKDEVLLSLCYVSCLDTLVERGLRSIGLVSVSTGSYGFPLASACNIVLRTLRRWLEAKCPGRANRNLDYIDRVVIVAFDVRNEVAYQTLMPLYFPAPPPASHTNKDKEKEKTKANDNDKQPKQDTTTPPPTTVTPDPISKVSCPTPPAPSVKVNAKAKAKRRSSKKLQTRPVLSASGGVQWPSAKGKKRNSIKRNSIKRGSLKK